MFVTMEIKNADEAFCNVLTAEGVVLDNFVVPAATDNYAMANAKQQLTELGYRIDGNWHRNIENYVFVAPLTYDNE